MVLYGKTIVPHQENICLCGGEFQSRGIDTLRTVHLIIVIRLQGSDPFCHTLLWETSHDKGLSLSLDKEKYRTAGEVFVEM